VCEGCDGPEPWLCRADGTCREVCCPDCDGRECGTDGCDGTCGSCDDGNDCTTDTCGAAGACTYGVAVATGCCEIASDCFDANPCTTDTCDPVTHHCAHEATPPGGQPCDAGGGAGSGVCNGSECVPDSVCGDGDCSFDESQAACPRDCGLDGFVYVPPGELVMGSPEDEPGRAPDEGPLRRVSMTRGYWMKATEVTQGEWKALLGAHRNPSYFDACGDDCPVESVYWTQALAWCNARSRAEGLEECYEIAGCGGSQPHQGVECTDVTVKAPDGNPLLCEGYRLPTEAEWEHAARAGSATASYNGPVEELGKAAPDPNLDEIAWYGGNSEVDHEDGVNCLWWQDHPWACGTQPVGAKEANAWGLHDMIGNVGELVWDLYGSDYYHGRPDPDVDPLGPQTGQRRVVRGGSWFAGAASCRAAQRDVFMDQTRYYIGFRPVRSELSAPPCESEGECDDANACTLDECRDSACHHRPNRCDDQAPCTLDWCVATEGKTGCAHSTAEMDGEICYGPAGQRGRCTDGGCLYCGDLEVWDPVAKACAGVDELSGLVGHWDFEEGGDFAPRDGSGSGHDGSLINGALRSGDSVCGNHSLSLDTTSRQYVEIPTAPSLERTERFTLAAWVKPTDPTPNRAVIAKQTSESSNSFALRVHNGVATVGGTGTVYNVGPFNTGAGGTMEVDANTWTHVAGSWDSSTGEWRVYVNGVLDVTTVDARGGQLDRGSGPLRIGYEFGAAQTFDGLIDDVRMYGRALSADEVALLFESRVGCVGACVGADCDDQNECTVDGCDPGTGCTHDPVPMSGRGCRDGDGANGTCSDGACVPCAAGTAWDPVAGDCAVAGELSGLVGRWDFEGTGTTVNDGTGNGHDGAPKNGASRSSDSVCGGSSLSLESASNQYVEIPSTAVLDPAERVTLAAWIKAADTAAYQTVMAKPSTESNSGLALRVHLGVASMMGNGHLSGGGPFNTGAIGTTKIEANTWTHIAGTWDTSAGEWKVYVNGHLDRALVDAKGGRLPNSDVPLRIGFEFGDAGTFDGLVDDARIYDRALTAGEVALLARACQVTCGDGSCDAPEDLESCPEDCTPEGFVPIPAGSFTMGSPADELGHKDAEAPQREVHITRPMLAKTTEVTVADWNAVMEHQRFAHCGDDCPAWGATWYEAMAWCNARSEAEDLEPCYTLSGCDDTPAGAGMTCTGAALTTGDGKPQSCEGYRLPTEAEWEYMARAGTETAFHSGDITYIADSPLDPALDAIGWYRGNSASDAPSAEANPCHDWGAASPYCAPQPVAGKEPNRWGLYDMSGNVAEWVWDRLDMGYYATRPSPDVDPTGPAAGNPVHRGGSWSHQASMNRSAYRSSAPASSADWNYGFRAVRTLPAAPECEGASDCDDGNACTDDLCDDGSCWHPANGCDSSAACAEDQAWDPAAEACAGADELSGLVGRWDFEGSGSVVSDSSEQGNDGSFHNGASRVDDGVCGSALSVSAASKHYVSIPSNAGLDLRQRLTYSAWIKPGSGGPSYQVFMAKPRSDTGGGIALGLNDGLLGFGGVGSHPSPWGPVGISPTEPVPDNAWVHVTGTWDSDAGVYLLYVDGVLASEGSIAPGSLLYASAEPLYLGREFGGFEGGRHYDGLVDDARVYNRALTPDEVALLARRPPGCEPCGSGVSCGGVCCPEVEGYNVACNARAHCEYASADPTRAYDAWIYVPPASFQMGAAESEQGSQGNERPVHTVSVAEGFLIAKYEIPVMGYEACELELKCSAPFVEDDPTAWGLNRSLNSRSDHPQNGLSWSQARGFCAWAVPGGRLPTEAEWELAATGPVHQTYPWGEGADGEMCDYAVLNANGGWGCGEGGTWPVGSKPKGGSAVGAVDMGGNVWEWCEDWYHASYHESPDDGSAWLDPAGEERVVRGGCFYSGGEYMRSAARRGDAPHGHWQGYGARCVRDLGRD